MITAWQQRLWLSTILLFAVAACTGDRAVDTSTVGTPGWSTDVIGVDEVHLSVNYWIDREAEPDAVLAEQANIQAFVRNAFEVDPSMVDLATYPETLPGSRATEIIRSLSKPSSYPLSFRDGGLVSDDDYARYTASLDLPRVPETVDVRFGMVVERADMRTWPTSDIVYKSVETIDLDRFQENGLFPADIVVVLHESADGQWYFVQSYNYAAWVRRDSIAIGSRDEILEFQRVEPFLVIAGSRVTTNFSPLAPAVSELKLEMGTRLPLVDPDTVNHNVDGQNPFASYIVRLPTRTANGALEIRNALIARSQDVRVGYMPYTPRNVLHQAFKFLGERYGWGHSYNARDCTGLVQEVYKTFGFALPRNSGQQGSSPIGENIRFSPDAPAEEKLAALAGAEVGDLLYSKGHVMMYLGTVDGEPYVIHDLSGSGWTDADGNFQQGVLNGVSVTPLRRVNTSPEATYFEEMYAIKRLR